jgi:hypothetical protein
MNNTIDMQKLVSQLRRLPDVSRILNQSMYNSRVIESINSLMLSRNKVMLSLYPLIEKHRCLLRPFQIEEVLAKIKESIIFPSFFVEFSRIHERNLDLSLKNLSVINSEQRAVVEQDIFVSERALESLMPQQDSKVQIYDEINFGISATSNKTEAILHSIDPVLAKMYRGALNAHIGDNCDKARHVFISLRELFSRLLNFFAPKDEVFSWVKGMDSVPENYILKDTPTRKAQIAFHFKKENGGFLAKFTENSKLRLESLINNISSVHEGLTNITEEQLSRIVLCAKYSIDDLLLAFKC